MKKVWVLEKFATHEELQKSFDEARTIFLESTADEEKEKWFEGLEKMVDKINDNPNGIWTGYIGKCKYSDFCRDAVDILARDINRSNKENKKINLKKIYRVVSAEIEDNSNFWTGYVNPVENEGVMKYLVARSLDIVKGR